MTFPTPTRPLVSGVLLGLALAIGQSAGAADSKGMAYVSNQNGAVTVIDLSTMEVVSEIDVGSSSPRGIGVTSDGRLLVTANGDDGDISVIDRVSGKLIRRVAIGKNPEFVRIRGDYAFVSFEPAAVGGPPPKPGSEAAKALEEEREKEHAERARIAVVDLKQGKVVREIIGGMETEGIEFSADGEKIIVSNEADENLTVHDISTGELVKTIDTKPYGNRPRGIKRAPDGKHYVASLEFSNKLVVLDSDFNVVKAVSTGDVLFVALSKGKALQVFDTNTWTPVKSIPTGNRCWHFTFTPDESHILVACGRSNDVVVIDTKTMEPVKHIADKKLPWGIVTYPKAIGSLDMP
jgi:YVTN family beta-propeller protein